MLKSLIAREKSHQSEDKTRGETHSESTKEKTKADSIYKYMLKDDINLVKNSILKSFKTQQKENDERIDEILLKMASVASDVTPTASASNDAIIDMKDFLFKKHAKQLFPPRKIQSLYFENFQLFLVMK